MYKVVAIMASKRKKNTYKVVEEVQGILAKQAIQVEIINLYDYQIESCIGCEVCILKERCVLKDDTSALMEKLQTSDGIILASPVYLENISGKLKTFIDRTCAWFHRPVLYGKPLMVMATTKGSGLQSTLDYLQSVGRQWGMLNVAQIGRNVRTIKQPITEKECNSFIRHIKMDKKDYVPSFESIKNFQVQRVLANGLVPKDQEYWLQKGWDKKVYYFDCKINPLKKLAGMGLYYFLNTVIHGKKRKEV